jgi:hypothetical protein
VDVVGRRPGSIIGRRDGASRLPWSTTTPDLDGDMLELGNLDLEEIATALEDQTGFEKRWLINPRSGQIVFWTEDGGIDGRAPRSTSTSWI